MSDFQPPDNDDTRDDDDRMADQGTEQWRLDRMGRFTASKFAALFWDATPYKSGPRAGEPREQTKARTDEIDRVVAEILTGKPKANVSAKNLDYGHEMEPYAIAAYEARTGQLVEQVGFLQHPDYPFAGASPDFLSEDDEGKGGGEAKCPISEAIHAGTLRAGLPPEHIEQIQGGLWATGRMWWDFISYNPNFPGRLALYVQRVRRNEPKIVQIRTHVLSAWDQVQAELARLRALA